VPVDYESEHFSTKRTCVHIRRHSGRFICIFLIIIGSFLYFLFHLVKIQFFRADYLAKRAEQQHNHSVKIEPMRGMIFDRNLHPLALNVTVYSLYANPRQMGEQTRERAVKELSTLLGLDPGFLRDRLSRGKYFVWIKRRLSFETATAVRALDIPGLGFMKESKRFYPNNEMAAHIIGFAGVDNTGLEGLELQFEKDLHGRDGWARILRDAKQRDLLLDKEFVPAQDGFNLILTIDETIQFIAEQALDAAFQKYRAQAATIVVMDPRSGEILALANRPTYNLNDPGKADLAARTNRAIAYVYEPGSVFKIVAASAALEQGIFKEDDVIFCENGKYRVGNHILTDHVGHGNLKFKEVIEQSSNIGTTKVAQKMGPAVFYKYAKQFRFGRSTGIDLRGEVQGLLKPPAQWSATSIGALPIGYEVTVTPLQLLCAISAVANGGLYMKPFVVKYITDSHDQLIAAFEPQIIDRVIDPATAERLTKILEGAVENGTGKRARVAGVRVAGKTGTARKVVDGKYVTGKYYASFIGFAPVDDPKIAAVVVFDEPRQSYFGGTVAAPVFQEMLESALKYWEAVRQTF
jgi:cell division protein FtsI/penicillin-binding protein 2